MKRASIVLYILACVSMGNIFGSQTPKIVNPKDQTDVYGIPTDMDEVEEGQEMQAPKKK